MIKKMAFRIYQELCTIILLPLALTLFIPSILFMLCVLLLDEINNDGGWILKQLGRLF